MLVKYTWCADVRSVFGEEVRLSNKLITEVQRIQKIEFIEIMRRQGYSGNLQQLFHELEDDSGAARVLELGVVVGMGEKTGRKMV